MSASICRWGILGTARIARKHWKALRLAENCRLVAVASRNLERSRQFIAECQANVPFDPPPAACGSYEELLERSDVDAVYIPLPTGVRKEWVLRAARAGKHVLVEKPVGLAVADVREMLEVCRQNNVQFMDGVMFMHSRRLERLRETLDDGVSVGRIRRIESQFSVCGSEEFHRTNIRVNQELEPFGCLGDLGWYNIRFTLWALKWQMPHTVTGRLLTIGGRGEVPLEFSAELLFPEGVSASFYCSFITGLQQWVNVGGEKGYVHVPDFVLPFVGCEVGFSVTNDAYEVTGCEFNMEHHSRRVAIAEYGTGAPSAQETNLLRNFSLLVLSGKVEPMWGDIALKTQQVLEACLKSALEGGRPVSLPR